MACLVEAESTGFGGLDEHVEGAAQQRTEVVDPSICQFAGVGNVGNVGNVFLHHRFEMASWQHALSTGAPQLPSSNPRQPYPRNGGGFRRTGEQ